MHKQPWQVHEHDATTPVIYNCPPSLHICSPVALASPVCFSAPMLTDRGALAGVGMRPEPTQAMC